MSRRTEKDLSPLGVYLNNARITLGLMVIEVADIAAISRQCWYDMVYGNFTPRRDTLARVTEALRADLALALRLRESIYVPSRLELTSLSDETLEGIVVAANRELARRRDHGSRDSQAS